MEVYNPNSLFGPINITIDDSTVKKNKNPIDAALAILVMGHNILNSKNDALSNVLVP
jgi:hypothetical protein